MDAITPWQKFIAEHAPAGFVLTPTGLANLGVVVSRQRAHQLLNGERNPKIRSLVEVLTRLEAHGWPRARVTIEGDEVTIAPA